MERVVIMQVFLMVGICRNIGRTKHSSAPIAVYWAAEKFT